MINYYKTLSGHISNIKEYEENCWVKCVSPTDKEINYLQSELGIEPDIVTASLDPEENSRMTVEGKSVLIVVDSPIVEKTAKNFTYYTKPISIIITPKNIVTVSREERPLIDEFSAGSIRYAYPEDKTHFTLKIILRIAGKYLQYLNQIIKMTERVEDELKRSIKDKDMIQLLEIKKSLVYFSASLNSISGMLEKLSRGKHVELSEDDSELIKDIMVEIKQASEMSATYLEILSISMDTFSSLISNNLNDIMKVLTSVTLVLSMPTMVAGIYGMNSPDIPFMDSCWFSFVLMLVLMLVTWIILKRKDMI